MAREKHVVSGSGGVGPGGGGELATESASGGNRRSVTRIFLATAPAPPKTGMVWERGLGKGSRRFGQLELIHFKEAVVSIVVVIVVSAQY
jgi:hypothetical protein